MFNGAGPVLPGSEHRLDDFKMLSLMMAADPPHIATGLFIRLAHGPLCPGCCTRPWPCCDASHFGVPAAGLGRDEERLRGPHRAKQHHAHWCGEHFGHEEAAAPEGKDPETAP